MAKGTKHNPRAKAARKKDPPNAAPVVRVIHAGCACNHQWQRWLQVMANAALMVLHHWDGL